MLTLLFWHLRFQVKEVSSLMERDYENVGSAAFGLARPTFLIRSLSVPLLLDRIIHRGHAGQRGLEVLSAQQQQQRTSTGCICTYPSGGRTLRQPGHQYLQFRSIWTYGTSCRDGLGIVLYMELTRAERRFGSNCTRT